MAWLAKRILLSMMMLFLVVTIVFFSVHMIPGDPAAFLAGSDGSGADAEALELLRERMGLNQPWYIQYFEKLWALAHFDLGTSLINGASISAAVAARLPRTLELIGAATIISLLIGIPAGVAAAMRRDGLLDRVLLSIAGFAQSLPVFVIGTLSVLLFAQMLRLVPAGGYVPFSEDPGRYFKLLIMPAMTIAIGLSAIVFRITRSSVLEVLPQDYVRTARAKGIPERRVRSRHILRNALMPVVTVVSLSVGNLMSGTVLVEYVFNWPGLSGLLIGAVHSRDYSTITSVLMVTAAIFILINLVVDILYSILDPRVRQ